MSLFPNGLHIGKFVMMELRVNGEPFETAKLEFYGYAGEWLHFVNPITGENHLVKDIQFPKHTFLMGRENVCTLKYVL